jgi:hypothetical protein
MTYWRKVSSTSHRRWGQSLIQVSIAVLSA